MTIGAARPGEKLDAKESAAQKAGHTPAHLIDGFSYGARSIHCERHPPPSLLPPRSPWCTQYLRSGACSAHCLVHTLPITSPSTLTVWYTQHPPSGSQHLPWCTQHSMPLRLSSAYALASSVHSQPFCLLPACPTALHTTLAVAHTFADRAFTISAQAIMQTSRHAHVHARPHIHTRMRRTQLSS